MIFKDTLREIKKSYKRFFSLLLMAFLGVGFFAGVRATSPDMEKTLTKYYDENNVYDIRIISTAGLNDDDIKALEIVSGVNEVYGTYSLDSIVTFEENDTVAKVLAVEENVNKFTLVEGRMPENDNECVLDELIIEKQDFKIGDILHLNSENLKEKDLEIVGIVNSSLYYSRERGNTSLGKGIIDYFLGIPRSNFNLEFYTDIYLTIDSTEINNTDKYKKDVAEVIENIEIIKNEREQKRYDEITSIANKELEKELEKLQKEEKSNKEKLRKIKDDLDKSKEQINQGIKEVENGNLELNDKRVHYQEYFNNFEKELEMGYSKYYDTLTMYGLTEETLPSMIETLKMQATSTIDENEKNLLLVKISNLEQLVTTKVNLDKQKLELNTLKEQTFKELDIAQETLDITYTDLMNALAQVNQGYKDYKNNLNKLNKTIENAYDEIAKARKEIEKIENPKWYILDLNSSVANVGFEQNVESIAKLGKVFPIVFFVIAVLISLTSMTRMVEEQRTQIGTLKALGYSNISIASKYIIYAALATILGSSLGMVIGCKILPDIIWSMYSIMYRIPTFVNDFNPYYSFLGLVIILICILGATLYSSYKELKDNPAIIMRPKPPKSGKRVFLEHIPFIWKKLNFTNKVTVRNMFRYKKRFLMTIIGIMGCTALIVTGFGIRDAITNVIIKQHNEIFKYDMTVTLTEDATLEKINYLKEELSSSVDDVVEVNVFSSDAEYQNNKQEVQVVVPKDTEKLKKVIKLPDADLKDTVFLTEKAADLLNISEGEELTLVIDEKDEYKVRVGKIAKNYMNHYIYMSKELYEQTFSEYQTNEFLIKYNENTVADSLSTYLLENQITSSISTNESVKDFMDNTLDSLKLVVGVLIIASGILAFVVLYNLSTVNISERKRELSTIKVLGFYDKEVYNYLAKETKMLTIIGILLGLGCGYILNKFIVKTCEINILRFDGIIEIPSYFYAVFITLAFTIIVDIFTNMTLKKIDMVESLKSIE